VIGARFPMATEAVPNELPQDQRAQWALWSCILITKRVALTSGRKTTMISIPSHVSELSKVRSLCLAWRREGPCHSTTQRGQEPSDRKDGRSPASGLGAVAG
jgi:hypothetical protein